MLGMEDATLRNFASLADRFELSLRRDNLSYGHHKEVQGIKTIETSADGKLYLSDVAEIQNHAARIRIMSERKAGELLAKMENAKTGPKQLGDTVSPNSLESMGIDKKQSSRWQDTANDFAPTPSRAPSR